MGFEHKEPVMDFPTNLTFYDCIFKEANDFPNFGENRENAIEHTGNSSEPGRFEGTYARTAVLLFPS